MRVLRYQHVTNVTVVFSPDTCLAHKNRETRPSERGEKGIHGPQCGDLTVFSQSKVNNSAL